MTTRLTSLYVDNAELYQAYVEYRARDDVQAFLKRKRDHHARREACKASGEKFESDFEITEAPPLPEIVAVAIYKIAHNYARKKNWQHLHFLEEMIGDGIIYCLKYGHNFDPEKSKYPYSYITTMIHNSFLQKIHSENYQRDIKREMWMRAGTGQVQSATGTGSKHFKTQAVDVSVKSLDEMVLDESSKSPRARTSRKKKKASSNPVDEALGI